MTVISNEDSKQQEAVMNKRDASFCHSLHLAPRCSILIHSVHVNQFEKLVTSQRLCRFGCLHKQR